MAPRANWKGFLKLAELTCPVALYTAASTSERIAFHTLNRETGNRVRRQFVDQRDRQAGRARRPGQGLRGRRRASMSCWSPTRSPRPCRRATRRWPSRPSSPAARSTTPISTGPIIWPRPTRSPQEAFALIRDGMRANKVAALAQTRAVPPRPHPADPAARAGPDRQHAELRLRGQVFGRERSATCPR